MLEFQQEARIWPERIQKIKDGRKEIRLLNFEGMNSALKGNDHSLQQKTNASKFLEQRYRKTLLHTLVKKFINYSYSHLLQCKE